MKPKLFLLGALLVLFAGCKKDSKSSTQVSVKYELVTTGSVINDPSNYIVYTNNTGNIDVAKDFNSGTSWSKTVIFSYNPFEVDLGAQLSVGGNGTVTANIYVNGQKKSTATSSPGIGHVEVYYQQ